jgi:GT2 family glycosyltransferase
MSAPPENGRDGGTGDRPTVSIVFLVYNRKDELRESLQRMQQESTYPHELVDVIVVDNASEDGSGAMVAEEFPEARLIRREENCGVSGWNDGFAAAGGDLILALDDDCYLPPDGLSQAVAAMGEHDADLVSFSVRAADNPEHIFNEHYRTGLLSFWGCAVLIRREVLERLTGYDPEIFVWANELEFMLRFFDAGFRHLHLPEVVAVHMKATVDVGDWTDYIGSRAYRLNHSHFAYIAAKLLRARDSFEALTALLMANVRDGLKVKGSAFPILGVTLRGFLHGLRHRSPVRKEVSRTYRRNFGSFASPWWFSRRPHEFLGLRRKGEPQPNERPALFFKNRPRYYPKAARSLDFPRAG